MKSHIVRRTQRSVKSLKRDKSLQSQDGLRTSSIAERISQNSQRKTLISTKNRPYAKSLIRTNVLPYDNFVRQMKIRLPTPKQKFYQFLKIPPFNRIQSQHQLIYLFLKNVKFFKIHQNILMSNLSKKVRLVDHDELDQKMMIIVLQGECFYKGSLYLAGHLVNRQTLQPLQISIDPITTKLLAINYHEYLSFLSSYIHQQMIKFKQFINGIQTFKMFNERTLQKFTQNLTLHYYLKGQKLFKVGDDASVLFVVFSGKVSRKVIIEIQKINKIPTQKYQRIVRILNKSYSHQIQFFKEDMVGVSEIIENVMIRKEQIDVDEDTILLGIDRSIIQESLDDYVVDRFKKYNLKKYPANYDQLCQNYQREKIQMRKTEERKIMALQNQLKIRQNDKKRQKIESIIKFYQENVKTGDNRHLLNKKLHFQVDRHT